MNFCNIVLILIITSISANFFPNTVCGQNITDEWRISLNQPEGDWQNQDYNDKSWRKANGGFGTAGTPGSRVGTSWTTKNIWLRKKFTSAEIPAKPALLIHHDEDTDVYLNGTKIKSFDGYTTEYKVVELSPEDTKLLKKGGNLLAVHCRQTEGGQFIDVHVVDAENLPELPQPEREPFISELITLWGEKVNEENVWQEYPRPQMQRSRWTNLNGKWDYAITKIEDNNVPEKWNGKILVPFCLESRLSGVRKMLQKGQRLWYRRTVELNPSGTTLLNFEAMDYECKVFVNRKEVGGHKGGNTPFSLDISEAARTGQNEIIVRVDDEQEGYQLRGKQTLVPRGIWYTQVSGIWQTVWIEELGKSYIEDLTIKTDAKKGTIAITPSVAGRAQKIRITVKDRDQVAAEVNGRAGTEMTADITDAKLWSPDSPHLYTLEVELYGFLGETLDKVKSYAGIRSVGKIKDAEGNLRFTLNGKEIFHWGPLDQGWWPDGLLTPPSDAAMQWEIGWLKKAGFNMIRKHIKVEPRRYYYHCDKLGMMVWQDQVSGGKGAKWTFLKPDPADAEWPDEHHQQFMLELESMIDNLENHPCIVCWVPFNEAWGQHRTMDIGKWVVERDSSRLVNIASGGNFWPVGDIVDKHSYPHPSFPLDVDKDGRFNGFIKVVGEFGGHGYPVKDHLWDSSRRNWGYGDLPENKEEYKKRFNKSIQMLKELKTKGIAGAVYTQTTDVEGEINGLMSYDRKVVKIPEGELAEITGILFK